MARRERRCGRQRARAARLTTPESPVSAWVLRTDEEAVIARHTAQVLRG
jgi:acetate kinase